MTTYIDPNTRQPQNLGELYSDRNIRITGDVRVLSTSSIEISATNPVRIYCAPPGGGDESVTTIAGGIYALASGSSYWVKISRNASATGTLEYFTSGTQPRSRRDYVQVFYRIGDTVIAATSSFLIYQGPLYTRLGYGVGQRVYDAIVNNTTTDPHATHSNLQDAITDTPDNGWILVKQMCQVGTMIHTGGKCIKFFFEGCGTGLQKTGTATTGIQFQKAGCQLAGFGVISGFTTGIDLNGMLNCRIEMVFSGNTTNISYGALTSAQVNVQGSYGLTENSTIETSTTEGTISRWNNTTKRWVSVPGVIFDYTTGKITSIGELQGTKITATNLFIGNANTDLTGGALSVNSLTLGPSTSRLIVSHPAANAVRAAVSASQTLQINGDGSTTGMTIDSGNTTTQIVTIMATTVSSSSATGALVVTGGAGIGGALNVATTVTAGGSAGLSTFIGTTVPLGTSLTLTAGISAFRLSHPSAGVIRMAGDAGNSFQLGDGASTSMAISSFATGIVTIPATTISSSKLTGALVVGGGVGIGLSLNVGTTVTAGGVAGSTTFIGTTAALGNSLSLTDGSSTLTVSHPAAGTIRISGTLPAGPGGNILQLNGDGATTGMTIDGGSATTRTVTVWATTVSSASTSGALVVKGGVGVAGAINCAGTIRGNIVIGAVYN